MEVIPTNVVYQPVDALTADLTAEETLIRRPESGCVVIIVLDNPPTDLDRRAPASALPWSLKKIIYVGESPHLSGGTSWALLMNFTPAMPLKSGRNLMMFDLWEWNR